MASAPREVEKYFPLNTYRHPDPHATLATVRRTTMVAIAVPYGPTPGPYF